MLAINAEFPKKLGFLFSPAPYKIAYGGRGGAKSWGFARALLLLGLKNKLRILCAREVQNSIADSVHKILSDQIILLGLSEAYRVLDQSIICRVTGTEFIFKGLQGTRNNVRQVKSTEGVDIIWVEEADAITKHSWDVVIPTIRKAQSEIWITFNPQLASDDTYRRFILHPPPGAVVVEMSWRDNPWFSAESNEKRLHMQATDPDGYLNVWEGKTRVALQGAIFANELRDATAANRITRVPHDPTLPVHTFWDLGWSDLTAIWMTQKVGFEYHLINYMEENQKDAPWFIREMDKLGYTFGTHYLPHDGDHKTQAAKGMSIKKQITTMGRKVYVLPRLSDATQISYTRQVFPLCWFDENKCAQGIERLRRYKYEIDEDTNERDRLPAHDVNSHGSKAFMGMAISIKHLDVKKKRPEDKPDRSELGHPELGPFVHSNEMGLGWLNG
jgi:phage terminase large subunit